MSGEKKADRQAVSSVGNSWIVTHSKSYPGRVYYFNTLTGEAVWNLSETESERARMRTKILEPNSIPAKCPEPKNNPPPQNIFHQEPVNNVNQELQSVSTYSDIAVTGVSAFNFNDMNKQIKSFNIIGTPTVFNNNPWAIAPAPQFYITPSIPVVNQGQALNIEYNPLIHNSQPGVSGYKVFHTPHRGRFQNHNTFGRGGHFKRCQKPLQKNDLRQRLALRRRLRNNIYQTQESINPESVLERNNECGSNTEGINMKRADIGSHIASMIEEVRNTCEMQDEVPNRANTQTEENLLTLDLSPLKCLAPSNANPNIWYIVVDYKVLLEEFELLKRMINSDESCCLLVPDNVMTELKDFIATSNNIPARRIFQYLSQKNGSGGVFLGQKPTQDSGVSISNPILKTCFDLIEENYYVILLTNDSQLLNYKKFVKVNIFTIDEIKFLLKDSLHEDEPKPVSPVHSPPFEAPLPLDAIKITIPGNQSSQIETMIQDERNVETVCDKELTSNETSQSIEINLPSKCTVDAAIQTDIVTFPNNDVERDETDISTNKTETQNLIQDSNKSETTQESGVVMPPVKRREIKLKRSVSQPVPSTSLDKGSEKKPLRKRWRSRKRLANCQESTTNNNNDPPKSNDGINVASVDTNTTNEISNNEHGNEQTTNSDEIAESRESSIICTNSKRESVVIEETSTSGIISNSESNIDVQSEFTDYKENEGLESNECGVRIDSEFMEESLRTKCEEWVSRFIQIMEEVLAVVLNKEPVFANVEMPPPWTVHEAAQCIRKYTDVPSVRRASDKLSGILFLLSDRVGKITTNMTAHQYMEMYDSGVSLLTAIKAITKCEDVEIAEESLRKLLNDIKNPYYGFNDSVVDHQENVQISEDLNDLAPEKTPLKAPQDDTTSKRGKYNLRSKSKSIEEPVESKNQPQPVKIIRKIDIKSSFLSNLNLQKISSNVTQSNTLFSRSQDCANERPCVTFSSGSNDAVVPSSKATNTPNIVRNFTKCPEFEERLKKKLEANTFENSDEYSDEEEDYMYTTDGDLEDVIMSDEEGLQSDPNVTQLFESSDLDIPANLVTSSPKPVDPSLANESNNRFKYMMCMFLKEVRNAINEVKVLCDKCYAELKNPQLPPTQRNELRIQIENAHLHIVGLCISLESMLDRDPNAPTDNIQTALKKAGINVSHVDQQLLSSYWDTIANCKKHADVFLFSVRDIIAGFKSLKG